MNLMLTSAAYLFAALAVGVMGFAIQRGATCTVAAVDEAVTKRSFRRLASIVEASLWVLGGLLIAQSLHWLGTMPGGYAVGWVTVLGGALLGLGAYVNRACVFGAIARLGSGEWAYVMTPVGFYVGCLSVGAVFSFAAPPLLPHASPVLEASAWIALLFVLLLLGRIGQLLLAKRPGEPAPRWRERLAQRVWSPHAATTVIGITFFFSLLLAGAWAYTDVLAELARGMASNVFGRVLLLVALFVGALIGGWTAGRFRSRRISLPQLAKCFAGGVLMGWGSLLIPGGNDGLILVGMPLLWPYAWIAFLSMCTAIALALIAEKALGQYAPKPGVE
ncbi:MAG TPA: YeeE/YedE thiosulfate transporter family protein [Casimicrobiaceae bacterium]|jgi:toxin CptA|nr:YeeE/YedE thiosulfate transporter family protein [Casimicrobiaceae bacterium]